jgi:hypothetical protein
MRCCLGSQFNWNLRTVFCERPRGRYAAGGQNYPGPPYFFANDLNYSTIRVGFPDTAGLPEGWHSDCPHARRVEFVAR